MSTMVCTDPKWGRVWRYQGPRGVSWRIRYQDATGRRVLETLGKEPDWNQRKAEAALRERLVDVTRDGYRHPDKTTFAGFADKWVTEHLPGRGLKQTTLESYQQTIHKHLLPAFGHLQLRVLEQQPELIDRYITQKTRAGYSPKTISNHLLVLQVMLKRALRWRLITRNPVQDCDRPRIHQPDLNVLTETEIARLWTAYTQLETDADNELGQAWWWTARTITFTALTTALRRGELLALHWQDIHLLEHRLHVRRAIVRGRLTTPKSRRSRRLLEIRTPHHRTPQPTLATHTIQSRRRPRLRPPPTRNATRPLKTQPPLPPPRPQSSRHQQTLPPLPRPPPHRPHPRSCSRQPPRLHPTQSRTQPGLNHRALHPRCAGALPRRRRQSRRTDVPNPKRGDTQRPITPRLRNTLPTSRTYRRFESSSVPCVFCNTSCAPCGRAGYFTTGYSTCTRSIVPLNLNGFLS